MTEEAAVFGGMTVGQGGSTFGIMAFTAVFFGIFLAGHLMEAVMVVIMGQARGGFIGSIPEEKEQAAAENDKNYIVKQGVPAFRGFSQFHILLQFLLPGKSACHLEGIEWY